MRRRMSDELARRPTDDAAGIHVQETAVDFDPEFLRPQQNVVTFQQNLLLGPRNDGLRQCVQYDVARCRDKVHRSGLREYSNGVAHGRKKLRPLAIPI